MMRWVLFLGWLVLCFAVAGISGGWTAQEVPGWYRTLNRPAFAPPNWVFAPVWTVLYALMAVAAWRVTLAPASSVRTAGLILFLIQLLFNFAWSLIFFRQHAIGAAFVEIFALWGLIGATTLTFSRISVLAAWLMAPYWAWVSFAVLLNWGFWKLNPR